MRGGWVPGGGLLTRVSGKPAQTLRPYWNTTRNGAESSSSHCPPLSPAESPAEVLSSSKPLHTIWLSRNVDASGLGSVGA